VTDAGANPEANPENRTLHLAFMLSKSELRSIVRWNTFHRWQNFVASLFLGVFLTFAMNSANALFDVVSFVVCFLLFMGLIWYSSLRKTFKQPSVGLEWKFTCSQNEFEFESPHGHSGGPWASILKNVKETDGFFYLWLRTFRAYHIVPKRAFASEADMEYFRSIVKSEGLLA
jgi:hypothetical protein